MLDLLRAPTIDRSAVEKLRADHMANLDGKSKKVVGALVDAMDLLTPEQRGKLADRVEAMAERSPMGGPPGPWGPWHGRPWGPWGGGQDEHDLGPDRGPGGPPDKD